MNAGRDPLVSVCIANYNGERMLVDWFAAAIATPTRSTGQSV